MNTFSENGNDFVGRLLHEGGVSRRTFWDFSDMKTASTVCNNHSMHYVYECNDNVMYDVCEYYI